VAAAGYSRGAMELRLRHRGRGWLAGEAYGGGELDREREPRMEEDGGEHGVEGIIQARAITSAFTPWKVGRVATEARAAKTPITPGRGAEG
jgi:hypothetical protein